MSYPLGKSFRIEDIIKSQQGRFLTIQSMWWDKYSKMEQNALVGGQNSDKTFITMSKCDPLMYDGIAEKYRVPVVSKPPF